MIDPEKCLEKNSKNSGIGRKRVQMIERVV